METIYQTPVSDLFSQLPLAAIVCYRKLLSTFPFLPAFSEVRRIASHSFTALLFAVSLFGFYQLGSLAVEAHAASIPPKPAASVNRSVATTKPATPQVKSLPRSAPTELHIPGIGVDAPVVSVGQKSDGSIEVPGPHDTGWYDLGPSPGEIGPAVIVGHVDYVTIGPAVFWNLRNMKIGDEFTVDRQDGTSVKFKVTDVQSYGQDAFPTAKVYGNINYPGLRLVTCTGDFNYATHHYSNDLVVYARAEL